MRNRAQLVTHPPNRLFVALALSASLTVWSPQVVSANPGCECIEPDMIVKPSPNRTTVCAGGSISVSVTIDDQDVVGPCDECPTDPDTSHSAPTYSGGGSWTDGNGTFSTEGTYLITVTVYDNDQVGLVNDDEGTAQFLVTVVSDDCCPPPGRGGGGGSGGGGGAAGGGGGGGDGGSGCGSGGCGGDGGGGPGYHSVSGIHFDAEDGKAWPALPPLDCCFYPPTCEPPPPPDPDDPPPPIRPPYMNTGCGGSLCVIFPSTGLCIRVASPVTVNGVQTPGWDWNSGTRTLAAPDGSTWEFNANGTLAVATGPGGLRETSYTYDQSYQDRVTEVTDALGNTWSLGVDPTAPGPTYVIDPSNAHKLEFSYVEVGADGEGRYEQVRRYGKEDGDWVLHRSVDYTYNADDKVTEAALTDYTDPQNPVTATTYVTYATGSTGGRLKPVERITNSRDQLDLVFTYSTDDTIANETGGDNPTYGVTTVRRRATYNGGNSDTADQIVKYFYYQPTHDEDATYEGKNTYLFREEKWAHDGSSLAMYARTTYKRFGFLGRFSDPPSEQANAKGQPWRIVDPRGKITTFEYDATSSKVSKVTASDTGDYTQYFYTSYTPGGAPTQYHLTKVRDTRGKYTRYTRNSTHPSLVTLVETSDDDSTYYEAQSTAYYTNGDGRDGLPQTVTVPDIEGSDDMVTTYDYTETVGGNTVYRAAPTSTVTQWYNGSSYENATVTNGYLPDGRLSWATDALGNRTDYEYDSRGRLARVFQPVDSAQAGTASGVSGATLSDSTKSWLSGELLGMALVVTSGDGEGVYDVASGSGTSVTAEQDLYAAGVRTGDTYELRPYTQTTYSECCDLAESERDERGSQTYYTYDQDTKRLTEVRNDVTGDSSTYPLVQYTYNDLGQTTEVRTYKDENDTSGRLTSYEYDQLGRVKRIVYPKDGGTTLIWDEYYQYDAGGNLVAKLQGTVSSGLVTEGAVTVYAYDSLSRLQYVEYDRYDGYSSGDKHWPVASGDLSLGSGDVSYTYSGGSGLKTQMVDSAGTSQYVYDARGRLTSYTPPKPSGFQTWYSVAYQYNNLGQKTQMTLTTPSSAQKVTKYLYFRDGSLKDVRWPTTSWPPTLMTQYSYYKNGPRNLTAYGQLSGEGWYHTLRTYNDRAEMTGIKHRHSNQLVGGTQWNQERIAEVVYGLDAGGNPLRIDEYYDAAGNYHRSDYEYDEIARLTDWTFGNTKSWTYDWVGNWLTSSDGTFVTDPDVDWLESSPVPAATYDYNKLGALEDMTVSANTDTFSYDDQDLLSQVSYGAGGSSTMVWDADQQRQKLTNSGGSTYFVYDPTAGVPAVLVETDGENETFYIREPGGELIARATGQTRQYYFFDRLGSTIAMVPAVEGNPTDRLFYTPWGELVTSGSRASTVGTTANPYRYVGELGYYFHHQDAGLADWMQLGVRFYEPELGRFERRDPVDADSRNAYGYTASPSVRADPHGLTGKDRSDKPCKDIRDDWKSGSARSRRKVLGHAECQELGNDLQRFVRDCVPPDQCPAKNKYVNQMARLFKKRCLDTGNASAADQRAYRGLASEWGLPGGYDSLASGDELVLIAPFALGWHMARQAAAAAAARVAAGIGECAKECYDKAAL